MLTNDQLDRYARHLILKEVGGAGQQKLLNSKVLVIGAGGLGSPLLMYLAAAGVGTLGIVDDDAVSLSNLQRQILHGTASVGAPKTDSARETIARLNPDIRVITHEMRFSADNAAELVAPYDLVADGTDNFETRFLVNDACYLAGKTLVSAAVGRFEGQLSTYKAHIRPDGERAFPCYRCIFPTPPPPGTVPTCEAAGILGAVTGVLGTLQAVEVLKELLDIGDTMAGRLLIQDLLAGTARTVRVRPDNGCALCGPKPTITALSN